MTTTTQAQREMAVATCAANLKAMSDEDFAAEVAASKARIAARASEAQQINKAPQASRAAKARAYDDLNNEGYRGGYNPYR